ncbi:MAG: hypothetical protein H6841_09625 [Planctomycetes bacterium]|nr:hypothetical protein [Planctomycetota bacterium]MCB9935390.1 hypothetical protein [Planctomycetota bacterium]
MKKLPMLCVMVVAFTGIGGSALWGQVLDLQKSPISQNPQYLQSGTAFDHPMCAFRAQATGGDVTLYGLRLTVAGSGSFTSDVSSMSIWLDDGDGAYSASSDQSLWSGTAASPTIDITFPSALTIANTNAEDLWIVASFVSGAGSSLGKSYQVSVASAADVSVDAASTVNLGSPAPQSATVTLIYFEVTSVINNANTYMSITGSGFTPPVKVFVGGVQIQGTIQVNAAQTEILLYYVAPNPVPAGKDVEIETASLGLMNTGFWYQFNQVVGRERTTPAGACAAANAAPLWPMVILLLGLSYIALRASHMRRRSN